MSRPGGLFAYLRRARHRLARALAVPAAAGSPAVAAAPPEGLAPVLSAGVAAGALLLLAVVATLAWRGRAQLNGELREARARSACVEPLLDVWLWQTDEAHRLVSVRPPHGAPVSDWSIVRPTGALWEHFVPADPVAVRAMLANAAAFDDLDVQVATAAPGGRSGQLRGRPHADQAGRFAGYHGTFRETAKPAAVAMSPARSSAPPPEPTGTDDVDHESFGFTVSHDLRAPIRVVEGFTKILKEDYGRLLDRVGNDHLDRVLGAAARMNNMIDALLALSRLSSQPLARQPVDLSQLAAYVIDDLRRQSPGRIVTVEIDPGMQTTGDPTLLRVVVENLIGNAWKYTGKSEDARISFGRHATDPHSFTVSDNGAGFDMRFADRLFGVFQRLHSASDYPGTGVGLASVRRIVRRHGGEIWGEGEVHKGARFHFSLPEGAAGGPAR